MTDTISQTLSNNSFVSYLVVLSRAELILPEECSAYRMDLQWVHKHEVQQEQGKHIPASFPPEAL